MATPNKTILSFVDAGAGLLTITTQASHALLVGQYVDIFSSGRNVNISSIADAGSGKVTVETASNHGLENYQYVRILADDYDGGYIVSNITTDTFEIEHAFSGTATGQVFASGSYTGTYEVINPTGTTFQITCPYVSSEVGFWQLASDRPLYTVAENSFDQWLSKTNQLIFDVGDKQLLTTEDKRDVVRALNETHVWERDPATGEIQPFHNNKSDNVNLNDGNLTATDITATDNVYATRSLRVGSTTPDPGDNNAVVDGTLIAGGMVTAKKSLYVGNTASPTDPGQDNATIEGTLELGDISAPGSVYNKLWAQTTGGPTDPSLLYWEGNAIAGGTIPTLPTPVNDGSILKSNTTAVPSGVWVETQVININDSNNVGIGTTSQAAKLAINGGLHVGGDTDPGDNNALIDGTLVTVGMVTAQKSLYVGNAVSPTDPGQDNSVMEGTLAVGGMVTAQKSLYVGNTASPTDPGQDNATIEGTLTLSALTTAGILHNTVLTGVITSSLIVNADVAAAGVANIDRNKLASGTASHVLINDGSGVMSSEAALAIVRGGTNSGTALTNGRAMVSSGGAIVESGVSTTQLGYIGSSDVVDTIGTIDTETKSANGAVKNAHSLVLQTADASYPGLVSSGTQIFGGNKTFNGTITLSAFTSAGIVHNSAAGLLSSSLIINTDIAASGTANIARNKLATGTAYRLLVNDTNGYISDAALITASRALVSDANGVPTHSATTAAEIGYVSGVGSSIQTQLNARVSSIGAIDSQSKSANGAVIASGVLYLQSADASYPGLITTGSQTIAGTKTFSSTISGNISGSAGSAGQVSNSLTPSTGLSGSAFNGSAARTWTVAGIGTNADVTFTQDVWVGSTIGAEAFVGRDAVGYIGFHTNGTINFHVSDGVSGVGLFWAMDAGGDFIAGGGSALAANIGNTSQYRQPQIVYTQAISVTDGDSAHGGSGGAVYIPDVGTDTGTDAVINAVGYLAYKSSSIRYKKDVEPVDLGLDFLMTLEPVKYKLKSNDIERIGFIAENVLDDRLINMRLIDSKDPNKGYQKESVDSLGLIAVLTKAIQELEDEVNTLKMEVNLLKQG